jgi:transposase-like protein
MGISGVKLDKKTIISALHKNGGVIAHAAKSMGCERNSIYKWIDTDPDVAQAFLDARAQRDRDLRDDQSELKELAHESIRVLLKKNDIATSIFIMKSLGGLKEAAPDQNITIRKVENPRRNGN